MLKKYLSYFLLIFISLSSKAQTLSNPGRGDSLFPVLNYYNDDPGGTGYQPYKNSTSMYGMIKANSKYYLMGNFTSPVDNNGAALIVDTSTNTILNNRKWRINGIVKTAIPDGQGGFYIGGSFTKIGDSSRKYIAQINANGKPTAWKPATDSFVNVLLKRNDTLFIGGAFKNFAGKARSCFAMYSTTGDSLCTNGGIQAFTFMNSINTFILSNDTLIYGGVATITADKSIRKYNFKNHVNLGWGLTYTDYTDVNFIQLSPDKKTLIYAGYYNGEYIKGANNITGAQQFFINLSMFWPYGSNSGAALGLKVVGAKAYCVGNFEHLLNNFGTFSRKGFFAFDPNTGEIKSENLNLNGYPSFLDARGNKLFLSGKFTSVNGQTRDQFAVVDTGTLAVDNWQLNPSDGITALAFTGNNVFIGGKIRGINAQRRNGFACIDSATHTLEAWNPVNINIVEGKRMFVRGDSLFILGYTGNSGCYPSANTLFKVLSLSTGLEYSINEVPSIRVNDILIDGNYMYVGYDRKLQRYSLPGLIKDVSWGYDWAFTNYEHSLMHLTSDANNVYAVGDTRYTSCANTSYAYRGYFDVYSKATGALQNYYYYEGALNQYDMIHFTHSILCDNRLYVQGYFKQLNGNVRRNFVCLNINNGAITPWVANFPNTNFTQSGFQYTSELKLHNGKIWFGAGKQILSDASIFKGLAIMDTVTGNLSNSPIALPDFLPPNGSIYYQGANITDLIVNDRELSIVGAFDTVNTRAFHNFAVFPLTGINRLQLCPGAGATLLSSLTGSSYQWQMHDTTGFADIGNGPNFSGTQTANLQLINIPSSWYGYKFRCVVNGNYSDVFIIEFKNTWTGAASTAWENPANWSCGSVPDAYTDVVINSGTVVINANTTIRSLVVAPGVNITVGSGVVLTVLH